MFYEPLVIRDIPYRIYVGKCRSGYLHWHSEMELLICTAGGMTLQLEQQALHLCPGDCAVIPGCEAHAIFPDGESTQRIAIAFGYSLLGADYAAISSRCAMLRTGDVGYESIRVILQAVSGGQNNDWCIRGGLFFLANALRQGAVTELLPSQERQNRVRRLESIYPILEHIKQNFRERITIEMASQLAGYDTTYFCKQFKSITGISFHQYLNRYRISVACQLLEDTRQPVAEVAEKTGFSSARAFCRSFKEATGMTATAYQALPAEDRRTFWKL